MGIYFIGIKEFRRHMKETVLRAQKEGERVVVTQHNRPLFEVAPVDESIYREQFLAELGEGFDDMNEGCTYTHEEVKKIVGLK